MTCCVDDDMQIHKWAHFYAGAWKSWSFWVCESVYHCTELAFIPHKTREAGMSSVAQAGRLSENTIFHLSVSVSFCAPSSRLHARQGLAKKMWH